jgi:hypothetical protein
MKGGVRQCCFAVVALPSNICREIGNRICIQHVLTPNNPSLDWCRNSEVRAILPSVWLLRSEVNPTISKSGHSLGSFF